ncbi:MAG: general secretion pathway protein GspB [Gammaproteobacteria bacterium]|nr:general secretion pathway protein GspB [Gammaproteobacteria bacterium]MDH3749909.1 general secretion pathway protein GspB [Gammaproteobacteria bacterium]MDH3803829.1 general secretion pathway protein GspB [Gammaproteobacteria bacterium]
MSFILDALKKSETERQEQAGAEFANVPSSSGNHQSFKWLWILALLLAVNIAFLLGILLRPDKSTEDVAALDAPPGDEAQVGEPTFRERIAEAKQNQPEPAVPTATEPAQQTVPRPRTVSANERVLSIDEVRANGTLQITDLHLDIHVYSDNPAERFVFINMVKHRERSELDEGPVVVEITTEGVILEHQGTTFLLPRE